MASLRRANTGFLALNSLSCILSDDEKIICNEIFLWLKRNNKFYSDISNDCIDLNQINYINRICPEQRPQGHSISGVIVPNENIGLMNNNGTKIGIIIKEKDKYEARYVPLNEALAMMFPLLFPYGEVPMRPNCSLRKQAQFILSLHSSLRCGRLGCYLLLYFYNLILFHETKFYNNKIIRQRIQMPKGVNRNFNEIIARPEDPAFPEYWIRKQNEVTAMIEAFRSPDLMITLTFNNNWEEIRPIREKIAVELHANISDYELYTCPIETMVIWNTHFKNLSQNGFSDITIKMGLGPTKYYIWRLEYQARGAPHIHALIWLDNSIHLTDVPKFFLYVIPQLFVMN